MAPTYTFQISMDYIVVVEIVEAAGDPDQLHSVSTVG